MGSLFNRRAQKPRRQELRRQMTESEIILWARLKGSKLLGAKFRRQTGIGPFIVDFYCPAARLVIEIDGDSHAEPGAAEYDARRQAFIEAAGLSVLRFGSWRVREQPDEVVETIREELQRRGRS
jgi:very-short-patch-repair endonuclease